MTSFTSNSNLPKPRPMLVLYCSVIAVVCFAAARPTNTSFSNPAWYWQAKVEWKKCANIVLAGNSRTYRGLSPVEFEKVLGGTAVNAGFSNGTYSEDYCDYLITLFDDDESTPNILVAGITHNAITDINRRNNGFADALKKSKETLLPAKWQQKIERYTDAFSSLIMPRYRDKDHYIQEFFTNGWVSSDYQTRNISHGLSTYKTDFENGRYLCSEQELEKSMLSLKRLSGSGVDVYCVWLPTSPQMSKLENEMSGIHRDSIESAFNKQGLNWISFPDQDYTSYDGSHLESDSASRFSLNTAIEIEKQIKWTD